MTLQKIADAVGVSYGTVHSVASDLIINSDIENERGQLRPMHSVAGDLISEIGIENARARVGEPLGTIVPKFSSPRVRGRAVTPCQNAAHSPHGWPCAAIACVFDW